MWRGARVALVSYSLKMNPTKHGHDKPQAPIFHLFRVFCIMIPVSVHRTNTSNRYMSLIYGLLDASASLYISHIRLATLHKAHICHIQCLFGCLLQCIFFPLRSLFIIKIIISKYKPGWLVSVWVDREAFPIQLVSYAKARCIQVEQSNSFTFAMCARIIHTLVPNHLDLMIEWMTALTFMWTQTMKRTYGDIERF